MSLHTLYPKLLQDRIPDDQIDLLPKHKGDITAAKKLLSLPYQEYQYLMPHLVYWLQDMNWPVADYIAELVRRNPEVHIALYREIFASEDAIWKYWVLVEILSKSDLSLASRMIPEIIGMTSSDENDLAQEALALLKKILIS